MSRSAGERSGEVTTREFQLALAHVVRNARGRSGLKQEACARLAGLSPNHFCRIELGQAAPTLPSLLGVAHALGLRPSELLAQAEDLMSLRAGTRQQITLKVDN